MNLKKFLDNEINVLNRLKHRNIVEFLGVQQTRNALYIAFELCEGGDFQAYLRRHGPLPELEAQKFFK